MAGTRLVSARSGAPLIHVKHVAGHAACRVPSTASVWHTAPTADVGSMQTVAGGEF
jgi:hypothetical protein